MGKINSIDLNADLGEGYPYDKYLFPLISSANIACGGHAGDENSIRESLRLCVRFEVAAGAHPSYPDKENFGRKTMRLGRKELQDSLKSQLDLFYNIAISENIKPHHVKLHGALYNDCFDNIELSQQVLEVVSNYNFPFLYGPSMSILNEEAASIGLIPVQEIFADRTYLSSGKLAPRNTPGALLQDLDEVRHQLHSILINHVAIANDGTGIELKAGTICLHGDNEHAVSFAKSIHELLQEYKISIRSPEIKVNHD